MALFAAGKLLSSTAANLGLLAVARFVAGMPQGACFGAGAVVAAYIVGPGHGGKAFSPVMAGLTAATIVGSPLATFLGQRLGWRAAGAAAIAAGFGLLAAVWAGFGLTFVGLVLFGLALPRSPQLTPA